MRKHGLDPKTYRDKHGTPREQPLAAREATARRRELVQQIRPWERAQNKRQGGKAKAKRSA